MRFVNSMSAMLDAGTQEAVFDGYMDGPSIKEVTHLKRTGRQAAHAIALKLDMVCRVRKENCLCNHTNKQKFINLFADQLERAGISTDNAKGEADVLIVENVVESAKTFATVLVGDDTDLIILLLYHVNLDNHEVFFQPEPKQNSKHPRVWDITKV